MIEAEAVVRSGDSEQEQEKCEARKDVLVKRVQGLLKEMAERDDDEDDAQRDEGSMHPVAEKKQGAGNKLDEGDGKPDRPEGPGGKERVMVGQEPLLNMPGGSELEYLVPAGHEEDQPENEPGE